MNNYAEYRRSQEGILNPKFLKIKNRPPINNNSNLYTNNSIQYYQITNPIENVFITHLHLDSNKPKKMLHQSSLNFRQGLNNNNKFKNSHPLFGPVFKSLLIEKKQYNEAGVFTAKIWLVYNSNLGFFDYVIEINPSQNFKSNTNKITKTIIPFIIQTLDISLIINALKKFGINIDETKVNQEKSKIFRWSFHVRDIKPLIKKNNNGPAIPSYVSAFTPFKNNRNKKVKNILASNGKTFLTLNNNNGPAVSLNSNNNNNGPVVSLNSNYKHKFRPISSL
jgi:hypothetical protein